MQFKTVSIIIPVFNEENYIVKTLDKVVSADTSNLTKEIIVVNDGSTDKTFPAIQKWQKENKKNYFKLKIINFQSNFGKGYATKTGFLQSKGDIVLVQDADLEYDPQEYPRLLDPFLHLDADVVYGSRFISHLPHRVLYFWHSVGNMFLTMLCNMFTNLNLTDMETGYKVFRGDLIRDVAADLQSKRFGFEPEITARIAHLKNIKIYEVGISYAGRTYEEGKKIGWVDGVRAFWEIFKFNVLIR